MISYTWKTLEVFANGDQLTRVKYLLTAKDDKYTVESEGIHTFNDGTVNKNFSSIVESDIWQWIEKDTTQNEVNPIKLALENQLIALEKDQKADLPWLAGTFTL
jgi:hypothetical protein